ncbi:MAG TPA: hypothetical protein VNM39_13295 [Verrucomicrobiae bacterium]|nr:hypothetical protein [Verrucomicrobiae bacterium]
MIGAPTPQGFAPIFQGWNVWDVWAADDPDTSILTDLWNAGESPERVLRVWIEDEIKDNAPGSAVADPANPAALKGDQIQPIPFVTGLDVASSRANIPALAGSQQLGKQGSKATLHTFRFFNRGAQTVMPWPHDENFLLDAVYTPSASNAVTNAPQPSSLGGIATDAGAAIGHGLETLAWVVGGAAALVLLSKLIGRSNQ